MLVTDLAFLAYWLLSGVGIIRVGQSRLLNDWNWSFLTLDMAAIALGLASLATARRCDDQSHSLMLVSLSLTSAAGLLALNFWALVGEFALDWWIPNLWLVAFPITALVILIRRH